MLLGLQVLYHLLAPSNPDDGFRLGSSWDAQWIAHEKDEVEPLCPVDDIFRRV